MCLWLDHVSESSASRKTVAWLQSTDQLYEATLVNAGQGTPILTDVVDKDLVDIFRLLVASWEYNNIYHIHLGTALNDIYESDCHVEFIQ